MARAMAMEHSSIVEIAKEGREKFLFPKKNQFSATLCHY
jgi:hypothetical protein